MRVETKPQPPLPKTEAGRVGRTLPSFPPTRLTKMFCGIESAARERSVRDEAEECDLATVQCALQTITKRCMHNRNARFSGEDEKPG
jgi:hypothetical protein